ncbi:hypothetical protein GCM10011609_84810 [Lentzea pudingi]|uniref:Uncharacterized protein n=1 Tax=Lentzea pudingi TaxID=1789439 RepID=A0ABQ2IVI9_9PSEU|nr:hypothetical protein GCM10011609_84810 [Lentzea pudingi]
MQQGAGRNVLIGADPLAGAPVQDREPVEPATHQELMHSRPGDTSHAGESGWLERPATPTSPDGGNRYTQRFAVSHNTAKRVVT